MRQFSTVVVCLACYGVVAAPAAAQGRGGRPLVAEPGASMDIVVRPVRNGAAEVEYAEIREVLTRAAGATNADFGVRGPGAPPVGAPPAGLEVAAMTDANGAVPVSLDSTGGGRRWRAGRPVTYPVTVTYKARMWPPGTRTNPSPMLRAAGGGVSGQGSGIIVMPDDGIAYDGRFRWDLSDLAPGSITTSGLTDENDVRAPVAALNQTFFMAGPLHRYPAKGDRNGFEAFWHGEAPWDGQVVMAWVASIYEYMQKFHNETARRSYRVLGRNLPPPAFGGTALPNHFIINSPAGPRDTADKGPLLLLAHEVGHLFVRGLQNPGGGGPSNNWFSEGLNEYYAVMLSLRSGLAPLNLVLQEMNLQTKNYYTNPRRTMPADSIAMFNPLTDTKAQNASYERGMLFWADMDSRIRKVSNGKRTLDSVILPLIARARAASGDAWVSGQNRAGPQPGWFTPAELLDSLAAAGGPTARQMFDSVIVRGGRIVPASNAFGPCFELRPTKMRDQYLGSSDARAEAAAHPDAVFPDTDAFLWARVASVPDARCSRW